MWAGANEVYIGHKAGYPLKAELNPICHLLALLAHHILHVSRIGVKVCMLVYCCSNFRRQHFVH